MASIGASFQTTNLDPLDLASQFSGSLPDEAVPPLPTQEGVTALLQAVGNAAHQTCDEDPREAHFTRDTLNTLAKLERFFAYVRRKWTYEQFARYTPLAVDIGTVFAKIVQSREFHYVIRALSGENANGEANSWLNSVEFLKGVGVARWGGGIVAALVAIYTIASQSLEIAYEIQKGRLSQGIDAILLWVGGWGSLCDAVSLSASGMNMAGWIGAVPWVTPLTFASAIISVVTLAYEVKGIHDAKALGKTIVDAEQHLESVKHRISERVAELAKTQAEMPAEEQKRFIAELRASWNWLRKELVDPVNRDGDYFVRRETGMIRREPGAAKLLYIIDGMPGTIFESVLKETSESAKYVPETRVGRPDDSSMVSSQRLAEIQSDLALALKDRVRDRITDHYVSIVSAIIGLIGVSILFYYTSTNWGLTTGLSLIAIASLISFLKYLHHKYSVERFEDWLNKVCPFDAIPDWYLDPTEGTSVLPWHHKIEAKPSENQRAVPEHRGPAWFAAVLRLYDYKVDITNRLKELTNEQKAELKMHIDNYQLGSEQEKIQHLQALGEFIKQMMKEDIFLNLPEQDGITLIYDFLTKIPRTDHTKSEWEWTKELYIIARRFGGGEYAVDGQTYRGQSYFANKPRKPPVHYNKVVADQLSTSTARYEPSSRKGWAFIHGALACKSPPCEWMGQTYVSESR